MGGLVPCGVRGSCPWEISALTHSLTWFLLCLLPPFLSQSHQCAPPLFIAAT